MASRPRAFIGSEDLRPGDYDAVSVKNGQSLGEDSFHLDHDCHYKQRNRLIKIKSRSGGKGRADWDTEDTAAHDIAASSNVYKDLLVNERGLERIPSAVASQYDQGLKLTRERVVTQSFNVIFGRNPREQVSA
jgi:hypothetical protein